MNFYTVRDLRTTPKSLWETLSAEGEVVITNNGKPTALLVDIADGSFEETVKAIRQAKAMLAFNSMRSRAAAKGFLTDEEIEAEIAAARGVKAYAGSDRHQCFGIGSVVKEWSSGPRSQHGVDRSVDPML